MHCKTDCLDARARACLKDNSEWVFTGVDISHVDIVMIYDEYQRCLYHRSVFWSSIVSHFYFSERSHVTPFFFNRKGIFTAFWCEFFTFAPRLEMNVISFIQASAGIEHAEQTKARSLESKHCGLCEISRLTISSFRNICKIKITHLTMYLTADLVCCGGKKKLWKKRGRNPSLTVLRSAVQRLFYEQTGWTAIPGAENM